MHQSICKDIITRAVESKVQQTLLPITKGVFQEKVIIYDFLFTINDAWSREKHLKIPHLNITKTAWILSQNPEWISKVDEENAIGDELKGFVMTKICWYKSL